MTARRSRPPRASARSTTLDVLAVGAHPDDVELGCGGTLARLASTGRKVGIVHLTSGEAGSRGTPEQRRREAAVASRALGAATLEFLDCGDGSLRTGSEEENALIEVLRRLRPRLVLGPPPIDRHPDHGRAHALLRDACFYSGLAKRAPDLGAPHRPGAVFCYLQHDLAVPTFVVDVTSAWARKMAALDAYESQLWRASAKKRSPAATATTFVGSRDFRLSIEARARHLGVGIGATYGEGFIALGPLAVADPLDLLPRGPH